jgi:hypothetical protein
MFCEFEDTKKIYRCKNCKLEVALENPLTKIICFHFARQDMETSLAVSDFAPPVYHGAVGDPTSFIRQQAENQMLKMGKDPSTPTFDPKDLLCSEDQIKDRMNICKTCEHFQNNSCNLCGCTITRDKNYHNKLANKQASCPAQKWGPVS